MISFLLSETVFVRSRVLIANLWKRGNSTRWNKCEREKPEFTYLLVGPAAESQCPYILVLVLVRTSLLIHRPSRLAGYRFHSVDVDSRHGVPFLPALRPRVRLASRSRSSRAEQLSEHLDRALLSYRSLQAAIVINRD